VAHRAAASTRRHAAECSLPGGPRRLAASFCTMLEVLDCMHWLSMNRIPHAAVFEHAGHTARPSVQWAFLKPYAHVACSVNMAPQPLYHCATAALTLFAVCCGACFRLSGPCWPRGTADGGQRSASSACSPRAGVGAWLGRRQQVRGWHLKQAAILLLDDTQPKRHGYAAWA
jgi:hypothetical protein